MVSKKMILIGDFGVGKTSLIRRFVDNQFSDSYLSTIGVKISRKSIDVDGITLQMLIWDIEGGTEEKPVNTTYIIGAQGCILVADLTRESTIEHIGTYIETVEKIVPDASFVLALNKSDKLSEDEQKQLCEKTENRYAKRIEKILPVSAKSGQGVEEMFMALATQTLTKG
ncbi:MAG: GTP-binding protein [Sulfurovum sp.]|nr:GTP-binding protein [Sulfurovum sp.]